LERAASDALRKELQQMKQDLDKIRSEVEVARAVAAASESSTHRTDAALAVRIHHHSVTSLLHVPANGWIKM